MLHTKGQIMIPQLQLENENRGVTYDDNVKLGTVQLCAVASKCQALCTHVFWRQALLVHPEVVQVNLATRPVDISGQKI